MKHEDSQAELDFSDLVDQIVNSDPDADRAEREEWMALGIARALRKAREAADMTQTMVSHASGLKQSVVSRLERAGHNPTLDTLSRFAKAVDADLILGIAKGGEFFPATRESSNVVIVPSALVREAECLEVSPREYVLMNLARSGKGLG